MTSETNKPSLLVTILGWYGVILSCTYLIWGIVSMVLSILDRTYKDFSQNIIIICYGLIILIFSLAFKGGQKWGWIGFFIVLLFAVVWSIFRYTDAYGIVWGVLSLVALVGVLLSPIRRQFFRT